MIARPAKGSGYTRSSRELRRYGPRIRLAALALIVAAAASCGGKGLGAETVERELEAIRSVAAEGALLADEAANGSSTDPFVRVHSGELGSEVEAIATSLSEAEPTRGLERTARAASRLARAVADALSVLEAEPGDRNAARRAHVALERSAKEAERLLRGS